MWKLPCFSSGNYACRCKESSFSALKFARQQQWRQELTQYRLPALGLLHIRLLNTEQKHTEQPGYISFCNPKPSKRGDESCICSWSPAFPLSCLLLTQACVGKIHLQRSANIKHTRDFTGTRIEASLWSAISKWKHDQENALEYFKKKRGARILLWAAIKHGLTFCFVLFCFLSNGPLIILTKF